MVYTSYYYAWYRCSGDANWLDWYKASWLEKRRMTGLIALRGSSPLSSRASHYWPFFQLGSLIPGRGEHVRGTKKWFHIKIKLLWGESPRPILARFLRYKDCEKLLSLGHRLRGTNYKMYQDLPLEIVERRKAQMETFQKARRNNIPAAFSKAQPDKLIIRGKLWSFGMPLELWV